MTYEFTGLAPRVVVVEIDGVKFSARTGPQIFEAYRRHVASTQEGRLFPGWEQKVWRSIQSSYPRYVMKVKSPASAGLSIPGAVSYLRFILRRGFSKRLVDPSLAEQRAAVCRQCPMREPVLGCTKCRDALSPLVNQPYELDIPEGCGACGCWLKAKAWLPREHLGSTDDFPYWSSCWMRSE